MTFAAPHIAQASAVGGTGIPPSERITLGVIGIGPRCTYDMQSILKLSRTSNALRSLTFKKADAWAGKQLVDQHYGNQDCELQSRLSRDARA